MQRYSARAALLAVLCATAANAGAHLMPMRSASQGSAGQRASEIINTASGSPHLNYYGGPILANVKVYAVFWGFNVAPATTQGIGDFYGAVTQSKLWDWLSEYSTAGLPNSTNQTLGHGSFGGNFTITPSVPGTTVTDDQIKAEIKAQIAASHLPKPDNTAGQSNTIYMMHFPPGLSITMGGSASCVQFCAYHSTIAADAASNNVNVYYGVLPDLGGACATGCGSAATTFDNLCSVSSHELIEATTDAAVGLASSYGPPLAWYDPQGSNGEIGDICNGQQGTITAGNGKVFTIQKEWSNASGACIATNSDAFSLSASPGSQNLTAGSSTTFHVATATTRGATQTIALSVAGLPSGVTGSFQPSSITAGGSSTLTLTASSSVANGSQAFTITGQGTASTQTASASVTVSGGSSGCPSGYHQVGGVCVPDGGCNSTGIGSAWAVGLLFGLCALALRRRKS